MGVCHLVELWRRVAHFESIGRQFPESVSAAVNVGIHPTTNLNVLLDRFILIQGRGKLMGSQRDMREGVWRRLWRLSVQQNCGAGWFTLNRQRGDFVTLQKPIS